jgi:hypothetical protein
MFLMRQDILRSEEVDDFEKIGPTAWMIAYRRTFTDIPYSQEIFNAFEEIRKEFNLSEIPVELRKIERTPLFEARYKLVGLLISKFATNQILEIASGVFSKGLGNDRETRCSICGIRYVWNRVDKTASHRFFETRV